MLRGLTMAALAVGAFLLAVEASSWLATRMATVPLCGGGGWLDCEAVLGSARWSKWVGLPVALPAVLLYGILTWAAFSLRPDMDGRRQRRLWWLMQTGTACAALAGAWFIYLQLAVLGQGCAWCMTEHTLSILAAGVAWSHGGGLSVGRRSAAAGAAVAAVAVLVGGQVLVSPAYTTQLVIGEEDERGRYVETAAAAEAVTLGETQAGVVLSRRAHPVLGNPEAPHVVVEVIDYTCPRCRRLAGLLKEALPMLGPDYAVMVLTYPLSHHCNPVFSQTDERHEAACDIAKLAHGVWAADATAFEDYHDWLFAAQDAIDAAAARAEAERRVGAAALADAMEGEAEVDVDSLLERDLAIADRLEVMSLPGLMAGEARFEALPEDADELAELIRSAFD